MTSSESSKESECRICNNSYWVINENGNAVRCQCFGKERINRRLRFACIPEKFKDMKLNTFRTAVYKLQDSKDKIAVVVSAIKTYLENFEEMQANGKGLYLFSDTKGSGKTRLAASIANSLLENHQVKFATSTAILQEIKKTYDKKSEQSESKLFDDLINIEILVIDDFGTEQVKDWNDERFYYLINERYNNRKVTIFTSNYSLETLDYDDRIINRIKEQAFQLHFPEESVRELIAYENSKMLADKIINSRS